MLAENMSGTGLSTAGFPSQIDRNLLKACVLERLDPKERVIHFSPETSKYRKHNLCATGYLFVCYECVLLPLASI